MKKYCTTHYGVYEETEGCLYCPSASKRMTVKAFKMTEARRYDNSEWPFWLHQAWQLAVTDPGCLYCSLNYGDPLGSIVLNTRKAFPELVKWGDYIVCGENGELALCAAETFEASYECDYNQFDLTNS